MSTSFAARISHFNRPRHCGTGSCIKLRPLNWNCRFDDSCAVRPPYPIMDYSSLPNDPDHPAGSSPWSTSPQHSRPAYSPSATMDPPPPTPQFGSGIGTGHSSEYVVDHEALSSSGGFTRPESAGTDGVSSTTMGAEDEERQPDLSERLQSSQTGAQGLGFSHEHRQLPPEQGQGAQRHRQSAGAVRAGHRANLPQYKLEAKITGLERTGRKDPILRFDVHVSNSYG